MAQVVLGAVSEADRHNIRGERISVDTIPLIGEARIAESVRAVARLHRAAILVLAGSLMGGEIAVAVRELREKYGIPVISLNMAGSVPDEADLVVSDPVQAGTMAVMAIADTALRFSLERDQRVKGARMSPNYLRLQSRKPRKMKLFDYDFIQESTRPRTRAHNEPFLDPCLGTSSQERPSRLTGRCRRRRLRGCQAHWQT